VEPDNRAARQDARVAGARPVSDLFLEFCGDELVVTEGQTLSFGRSADLVVDPDNVHLHRTLGCFASDGRVWSLHNLGRFIPLRIVDLVGTTRVELGPGDQVPISFPEFAVQFTAGTARYEILGALSELTRMEMGLADPSDTVEFAKVPLNAEQRLLVVCLAEPLLRGDEDWTAHLASNREVAERLGWTTTKFNRKLDYLCKRLAEQGVAGMQGTADRLATVRRQRLVEVLVETGAVTADDLQLLPPARPAAAGR